MSAARSLGGAGTSAIALGEETATCRQKAMRITAVAFNLLCGLTNGYDICVISAVLVNVVEDLSMCEGGADAHATGQRRASDEVTTCRQKQAVMSAASAGAVVAKLCLAWLADHWGRRATMAFVDCLIIAAVALQCFATGSVSFLTGRFVLGVSLGLAFVVEPAYVCEIAPPERRGLFVVMNEVAVCVGCIIGLQVGSSLEMAAESASTAASTGAGRDAWRVALALGATPAVLQLFVVFALPESPRWLATRGDGDGVRRSCAALGIPRHEAEGLLRLAAQCSEAEVAAVSAEEAAAAEVEGDGAPQALRRPPLEAAASSSSSSPSAWAARGALSVEASAAAGAEPTRGASASSASSSSSCRMVQPRHREGKFRAMWRLQREAWALHSKQFFLALGFNFFVPASGFYGMQAYSSDLLSYTGVKDPLRLLPLLGWVKLVGALIASFAADSVWLGRRRISWLGAAFCTVCDIILFAQLTRRHGGGDTGEAAMRTDDRTPVLAVLAFFFFAFSWNSGFGGIQFLATQEILPNTVRPIWAGQIYALVGIVEILVYQFFEALMLLNGAALFAAFAVINFAAMLYAMFIMEDVGGKALEEVVNSQAAGEESQSPALSGVGSRRSKKREYGKLGEEEENSFTSPSIAGSSAKTPTSALGLGGSAPPPPALRPQTIGFAALAPEEVEELEEELELELRHGHSA